MRKRAARHVRRQKEPPPFKVVPLLSWIVLCESAGILGSLFTIPAISSWYVTLAKPSFSPPNWIFGPVWTVLYLLMGIAAYRIWRMGGRRSTVRSAVVLFLVHLFFNAIWSPIFFGAQNIPLAFVDIGIIWTTLIIVIFRFAALDGVSAYLLVPYLCWVSFATVLNYN